MARAHDLDVILVDVLAHFAPLRRRIHVDWANLDDVDMSYFDERWDCAAVTHTKGRSSCIAIHPRFRRAPRYVIAYLIFHELLHIDLGCAGHPKAFSTAERLWPTYTRANAWITRFIELKGLT